MSKTTRKAQRDGIDLVDIYSRTGEKSQDEKLLQPYRHIALNLERTNVTVITNAYNNWFNVPKEKLTAIEDISRILYNASLLYDDIEDCSTLRRGSPVAHSIYGAASTLVAANYAYTIGIDKILDFIQAERPRAGNILERGFDLSHRRRILSNVLEEIEWCVYATHLFDVRVQWKEMDLSKFNNLLAEGFQFVNDYKSFASKDYFKRKTFCDDITEGKFTLPIIHAIRSHPEDHQIIDILRLRTTDYTLKRHCLSLMQKFGSLEYTRKRIAQIREEAMQEVKRFENNPQMNILITFAFGSPE